MLMLFAKTLALRPDLVLPKLADRLAADNVRRLLHVTFLHFKFSFSSCCDIKSVRTEYLWFTLQHMGFNVLNTMYVNPSAPVLTGNLLSSHFPVCQRCPLSAKRSLLPLCNLSDYAVASFKYLGGLCIFICKRNFWKLRFRQWNVTMVWNVDLKKWEEPVQWKRIWKNVPLSYRGYSYQMMHSCLTPRRRFNLQLCFTPICTLYNKNELGTYSQCGNVQMSGHELHIHQGIWS